MCQGGAGATGGSRAAAANVLLVDAVPQQQFVILLQNDERFLSRQSANVKLFVAWIFGTKAMFYGAVCPLC